MIRYMLDTNIVGHLIRQHPSVVSRLKSVPIASVCISAMTAGELLYGLAHRPEAVRLRRSMTEFMLRIDVLPWDLDVADVYGRSRAQIRQQGKTVVPMDMLIGAHALSLGAVLVTNDKAFQHLDGLTVEDWTQ